MRATQLKEEGKNGTKSPCVRTAGTHAPSSGRSLNLDTHSHPLSAHGVLGGLASWA